MIRASFKHKDFRQYPLILPQPWELANNVHIALTGSRPTSHRWTVYVTPKSPKGWHKTWFCCFLPVKFNLCRKKSAAKFLLCANFQRQSRTSSIQLSIDGLLLIYGQRPIYLKFVLKVTHPFRKFYFRQISLNSASGVKASEKSSIITNRKSTMHFISSHKWTLYVIPKSPKGWIKTEIFYIFLRCLSYLCCK